MCNGLDHLPKDCSTYFEMRELREHCNALGFLNRFNQQWQPNPNLSWRSNQSTSYQTPLPNALQQPFSLEEAFRSFIEVQNKNVEEQGKMNKQIVDE